MKATRTRPAGFGNVRGAALLAALLLSLPPAAVVAQSNAALAASPASGQPVPLKELLARWQRQYQSTIAYDSDLVGSQQVEAPADAATLEEALARVLPAVGLDYEKLRERYYILRPRAQPTRALTGRVLQPNGRPLPGATVVLKGTATGTGTDAEGQFSLPAPPEGALLISSVGFVRQEVALSANTGILTVVLPDDEQALGEVVVVGYGRERRATVTGAIAVLDSTAFLSRVSTNPLSALQGAVPGLVVARTSARPGQENWGFQVRGASSVNTTPPLVVVDGVPYDDNAALSSLNPQDIETTSVLKDASAAIYGSRAANGVILITTKKGKTAKPVVTYSGLFALKTVGLGRRFTTLPQWYEMYNEAQVNNNNPNHAYKSLESHYLNPPNDVVVPGLFNTADIGFFTTDLQEVMFGTGRTWQQNVAVAGRGERVGYYVSVGYADDGSILRLGDNSNRKNNARVNLDFKPTDRLKLFSQLTAERQNRTEPTAYTPLLNTPGAVQPGYAFFTRDGRKPYGWGISYQSPLALAEDGGNHEQVDTRLGGQLQGDWDATDHFTVSGAAAVRYTFTGISTRSNHLDFYNYAGDRIVNTFHNGNDFNSLRRETQESVYQSYYGQLQYHATVAGGHQLTAMVGTSQEENAFNSYFVKVNNVPPGIDNVAQGTPLPNAADARGGAKLAWALVSYFGRATYAYRGKYLFEAIGRYDGSSRFTAANNHRWKFFPGVSAGWVLTEESWLKDVPGLNRAKLRASWGVVGNQAGIGIYDYIALVNNNAGSYPFGLNNPASITTTTVGNLVALDRTWEQIATTNVGLDVSLLAGRLVGTVDGYAKRNRNMLIPVTYPATLGGPPPLTNNGRLMTRGWEAALTWTDKIGGLGYSFTGIVSDSRTSLMEVGGSNAITLSGTTTGNLTQNIRGFPLNSYFGYAYDGIIQTQEELDAYKKVFPGGGLPASLGIGDVRYRDLNGDGRLDQARDVQYLGNSGIRYAYSGRLGLTLKGFDCSLFVQAVGRRDLFRQGSYYRPGVSSNQNISAHFYRNTWSPARPDAEYPRLSANADVTAYNYRASALTIRNNRYTRLKNAVLGYTLPPA
ncbi:MAG: SusC/RagA family TonB-linked outer membrane protein, partial [Hymenobacter sp.]|nr:SusC/RagA family TonB-linked outer membrane protein [Hymenobacter sp.]